MKPALEFCAWLAVQTAPTPDVASLSDIELLQRFPAIAQGAGLLFLIGLLCDCFLLFRYQRRPTPPRCRVEVKSWGFHELTLATLGFVALNFVLLLSSLAFSTTASHAWLFSLWATLALNLVFLTGLITYLHHRGATWRELLGWENARHLRGAAYGFILYFAMLPPLALVTAISALLCHAFHIAPAPQPVVQLLTLTDSPWNLGLIVGLAVIVAPVFEEVFFRGFIYPVLKQRWGMVKALSTVSLAFALVHFHTPSAAPLFALGLAFALAYELTGSLATPILMHALFNSANVLMLLYVRTQL